MYMFMYLIVVYTCAIFRIYHMYVYCICMSSFGHVCECVCVNENACEQKCGRSAVTWSISGCQHF